MLYAGGKALGTVEAKPEGSTLTGVEVQSARYTKGLADHIPAYRRPLPFAYESTGEEPRFTNTVEPDYRSRELFSSHRPGSLIEFDEMPVPCTTSSGEPFLDVHHIDRLADGGPDRPDRVVAGVCPNCHRRRHYGIDAQALNLLPCNNIAEIELRSVSVKRQS